jgi:hypothetical protein
MILYLAIFFILFLFAFIDLTEINKKAKLPLFVLIIIFFILLGGLRWQTGGDWGPYYFFFTHFNPDILFFRIAFEPGYVGLVALVRYFSTDFTAFLLVFAILTNGLRGPFFYKYTNAVFLALLLYWGNHMAEFAGVRQALAISICLFAIPSIIKRKFWIFVLIVILAMQIHISAIIFLLAYPIFHARWSVRSKVIFLILSVLIGLTGIISDLLKLVASSLPGGLDRIAAKADDYSKLGAEATHGTNKFMTLFSGILKRALILPLMLYFEKRVSKESPNYAGFMNLFVLGNIIYFVVADFLSIQRMAAYFYPLEIVLLCMIFDYVKQKAIWFFIFSGYALVKLLFILNGTADYFIPYFSIFSNDVFRAKGLNF